MWSRHRARVSVGSPRRSGHCRCQGATTLGLTALLWGGSLACGGPSGADAAAGAEKASGKTPVAPAPVDPLASEEGRELRYRELRALADLGPLPPKVDFAVLARDLERIANEAGDSFLRANAALLLGTWLEEVGAADRAGGGSYGGRRRLGRRWRCCSTRRRARCVRGSTRSLHPQLAHPAVG